MFTVYPTYRILIPCTDWCVWAPPSGPTTIGDSEGQEVAWCTKPGRGTRLIPAGAITGVQFLRAKSYVEVIAFLDQTMLNLTPDDYGGELDSGSQDGVRFAVSTLSMTRV